MPWFVNQVAAFRSFILQSAVYPGKDAALPEEIKPAKPVNNGFNATRGPKDRGMDLAPRINRPNPGFKVAPLFIGKLSLAVPHDSEVPGRSLPFSRHLCQMWMDCGC